MHKEDDRYKKQPDRIQDPTFQSATQKRNSQMNSRKNHHQIEICTAERRWISAP
ncbi:hypothetical protein C1H46_025340 [Malus baccata]|uniref:Uncharacterized protein n=1 Tax=Malus baccata TaxID=106549 RepID=A0A540LRI9_MALBA|nr:hypothetical protein C1H46_025340 [Malus baccata]